MKDPKLSGVSHKKTTLPFQAQENEPASTPKDIWDVTDPWKLVESGVLELSDTGIAIRVQPDLTFALTYKDGSRPGCKTLASAKSKGINYAATSLHVA